MKVGIIGAMKEEIHTLVAQMSEANEMVIAGSSFYHGKIGEQEVVVTLSGIGKVLAAVTATLLIDHYQVDLLINTGSAGGIGKGLSIGDLVVSTELTYFDVDVTAFGYQKGQMAGMPVSYQADAKLIALAQSAAEKTQTVVHQGLIVSGDTFVNSQSKIDAILADFPEALANEMEGAAIAQVAYRFGVPFLVIRAISDTADEEASLTFDEFIVEAGKRSAWFVLSLIKLL